MENDLRNIWTEVEGELIPKSESELNDILLQKSTEVMSRFKWLSGIGISICIGVLTFLVISSVSLRNDVLYLINNALLAFFLVDALVYNIRFIRDLDYTTGGSSNVYTILNEKARKIERALKQKNQILLLPVISLLLLISIHVYFSSGSFIVMFQDEESMWGLSFGFLSGLIVSIYFERKINRKQQKDLKRLRKYLLEMKSAL